MHGHTNITKVKLSAQRRGWPKVPLSGRCESGERPGSPSAGHIKTVLSGKIRTAPMTLESNHSLDGTCGKVVLWLSHLPHHIVDPECSRWNSSDQHLDGMEKLANGTNFGSGDPSLATPARNESANFPGDPSLATRAQDKKK